MHAQRHLDLQGPLGVVPAPPEDRRDPVQALRDRVDVDVQRRLGLGEVPARGVVGVQRPDQVRAPNAVVGEHRADRPLHEGAYVGRVAEEHPHESQIRHAAAFALAAQSEHCFQAAVGLAVGAGKTVEAAYGAGGRDGDAVAHGTAEPVGEPGGQRAGVVGGEQEDGAAVAAAGQASFGACVPGGLRDQSGPAGGFASECEDRVRELQVDAEFAGAQGEAGAAAAACALGEEVVEQFAADPVLGVGHRAFEEEEQGGDERDAFEQALVLVAEVVAAEDDGAEGFGSGHDGADP